jgi:thioredoxin 1
MAKPLAVTDSEFEREVLQADTLVLVDFWAEWCGPCHQLDPIVEDLAEEYDGRVKFVKIDTEENFDTPARYGILGLPTLLVFRDGEQVDAIMGLRPKSDLKRSLEKALA